MTKFARLAEKLLDMSEHVYSRAPQFDVKRAQMIFINGNRVRARVPLDAWTDKIYGFVVYTARGAEPMRGNVYSSPEQAHIELTQ